MESKGKLCPVSLGFAIGLTWAIGAFLMGIAAWKMSMGMPVVGLLATIYHGYAPTLIGSVYGALWALLHGFITGALIAIIYDICICCGCRKKDTCCPTKKPGEM